MVLGFKDFPWVVLLLFTQYSFFSLNLKKGLTEKGQSQEVQE